MIKVTLLWLGEGAGRNRITSVVINSKVINIPNKSEFAASAALPAIVDPERLLVAITRADTKAAAAVGVGAARVGLETAGMGLGAAAMVGVVKGAANV